MSDVVLFNQAQGADALMVSDGAPGGKGDPGSPGEGYATRTAMAARLAPALLDDVYLTEVGREGKFVVDLASNWTAQIAADTAHGIFVASTADATKVYRRVIDGAYNASWFGFAVSNSAASNTTAAQAAIDFVVANGGGTVRFPEGVSSHSGLTFKNKVQYRGGGHDTGSANGTVLLYTGTGDGVQINNPINSSTAANVSVEGITFKNANRNAGKGCFADTGSTDLKFRNCGFIGSDRGLILDQSELVNVAGCDFEGVASQTSLVWIVNGADRTGGASAQFSNQIVFEGNCQFNGQSGTVLIADDGGAAHSFIDNNYNGGATHLRAAGVLGLKVSGGEWESATGAIIRLEFTSVAGAGVGVCGPVEIGGAPAMVPTTGQPCVSIAGAGRIVFSAPFFGNSTSAKVTGSANAAGIISLFASNGGGGANFDGMATAHFEIDTSGIKTNISNTIQQGAQLVFADVNGTGYEGIIERVDGSPFGTTYIRSKGGTGGWQGSIRLQVSYNAGTLFDALKLDANTDGTTVAAVLAGTLQAASFKVGSNQVVGARQTGTAANATDLATALTLVNDLKTKLIAHGLIS